MRENVFYGGAGYLHPQPEQELDRWSLQHDAGILWQFAERTVFHLHYINNITHNENTADMALTLGLTHRF